MLLMSEATYLQWEKCEALHNCDFQIWVVYMQEVKNFCGTFWCFEVQWQENNACNRFQDLLASGYGCQLVKRCVQVCSLRCLCFLFLGDREMNRNFFNAQFGSIFRTDENPTYFLRRLSRFADIYMASLSCLLNYEPDYTFYPRRTPLQHELPGWSDQLCTGTFRIPFLQETVQIK